MAEKFEEWAVVVSQKEIATDIFDLTLQTKEIAKHAKAGQFISMYCNDKTKILPRPISLCEIDREKGTLRLIYRVTGEHTGTKQFSQMKAGEEVGIIGPLGNGFTLGEKKAFLIGGGIGIPPMLQLAKELKCEKEMILGFRDELFLMEDFEKLGNVYVSTDDGSAGTKGTVIDAIKANALEADVIYACGPTPMLRALKTYAEENNMQCYISMEERMACGIGACLACVCKSKEKDHHTNVNNKRVCKEGPVFDAREVEL
ncbi:MAG: dihydroorotate dehydrogenase electron transfer subunit [Lachnospiraceae bacterium]|nr:dihydroorotate dehydrogenase electron transfer subunit [Lachnospiraceae bacterium]